jgi:hypothetical protein
MNFGTTALARSKPLREDTLGERELILSSLRVAAAWSRLQTNLLGSIGVALRQKRVDSAGALEWLKREGLPDQLPFGTGGKL